MFGLEKYFKNQLVRTITIAALTYLLQKLQEMETPIETPFDQPINQENV
ncbi:MAG: hypothetical protein JNL75_11160 [Chitinophagales bacterium]|nr:hypothetical protein [Chitinophagales bacterium]